MCVALRMQNMVQIRAWNACLATKLHLFFFVATTLLGLSALRGSTVGPQAVQIWLRLQRDKSFELLVLDRNEPGQDANALSGCLAEDWQHMNHWTWLKSPNGMRVKARDTTPGQFYTLVFLPNCRTPTF